MKPFMTHVVAGYPNLEATRSILATMIQHKVHAIEIQIPFSDPLADGSVLMQANSQALQEQTTRQDVLEILQTTDFQQTEVFIMCYYQSLFHGNAAAFITQAIAAGCKGFIIPDLPFDSPDMHTLLQKIPKLKQLIIPVVSPGMSHLRLRQLRQTLKPSLIYVTARSGVTGANTDFGDTLSNTTQELRKLFPDTKLAIGFGIKNSHDSNTALKYGDLAVVGSALAEAYKLSPTAFKQLLTSL